MHTKCHVHYCRIAWILALNQLPKVGALSAWSHIPIRDSSSHCPPFLFTSWKDKLTRAHLNAWLPHEKVMIKSKTCQNVTITILYILFICSCFCFLFIKFAYLSLPQVHISVYCDYRLLPMFVKFTVVCLREKLDGFLIELPGNEYGASVQVYT